MPEAGNAGPPSLGMVAAGGVGVLVVIAFVAAVALGGRTSDGGSGSRMALSRGDDAGGLSVLVPRCRDERVTEVALADAGGRPLWRIASRKGSIDERYVVGDDRVPLGFEVEVPLRGALRTSPLRASVTVAGDGDDVADSMGFDLRLVPRLPAVLHRGEEVDVGAFQARALASAACPESRRDVSLTTIVFGLGALLVVGCYGLMVSRWWRGRAPR